LSLSLTDAYIEGLYDDLGHTWYVPGPWLQITHQGAREIRVDLALDECGGIVVNVECAEPDWTRVRAILAKYNDGNANVNAGP
jgi:hypothetical protein